MHPCFVTRAGGKAGKVGPARQGWWIERSVARWQKSPRRDGAQNKASRAERTIHLGAAQGQVNDFGRSTSSQGKPVTDAVGDDEVAVAFRVMTRPVAIHEGAEAGL